MSNACITGCCQKHPIETKPVRCLKLLHNCCILCGKILASAILMSLTLWLFLRQREPSAYVNNFELGDENSKLVHYNITLHNPDIYKSVVYNSLMLRIFYEGSDSGVTVNLDSGLPLVEGGGRSTRIFNHTADIGEPLKNYLDDIKNGVHPFRLSLAMIVSYKLLNIVIARRQITRVARVYFRHNGRAFIDRWGLRFK